MRVTGTSGGVLAGQCSDVGAENGLIVLLQVTPLQPQHPASARAVTLTTSLLTLGTQSRGYTIHPAPATTHH